MKGEEEEEEREATGQGVSIWVRASVGIPSGITLGTRGNIEISNFSLSLFVSLSLINLSVSLPGVR